MVFWKKNKQWSRGKPLVFQRGNPAPCEWHHSAFSPHLVAQCSCVGTFHTELGKANINLN